jgi:hypothetical protein
MAVKDTCSHTFTKPSVLEATLDQSIWEPTKHRTNRLSDFQERTLCIALRRTKDSTSIGSAEITKLELTRTKKRQEQQGNEVAVS